MSKNSKYVDITSIIQVIGNVFNNPHLLDDDEKYNITEQDFPDNFHKIVFGVIYNLWQQGVDKITIANITDYLASRPKSQSVYEANNGTEWLVKVSSSVMPQAFDYYYNRLKKFTLLRVYDSFGIDMTEFYDPDNIFDLAKKQAQEDRLDNSSLLDIVSKIDERIDAIKSDYLNDVDSDGFSAGDGIEDLLTRLKAEPEIGIPMYGSLINTVSRGARLKKLYLRSAPTGTGKAIPNYTIIPTPTGPHRVDEIKEGQYLFGSDGKPTKVLKIHPQEEPKEIYKVFLDDGRVAECCKDHLWTYAYRTHRGWDYRTETTLQILERTKSLKNNFKDSDNRGWRFRIPLMTEGVEYYPLNYTISPYVMGAILGDGSLRYQDSQKALVFSSETDEIPWLICKELGEKYYPNKSSDFNYDWTFKEKGNIKHNLWVEELFKEYPELWNLKSEDKFIPNEYLYGSIQQRYSLLQGLLDTDGSIDSIKGRVNYTTVSPKLRDQVMELCKSLGFQVSCQEDNRTYKYTTGICYNIHIMCKPEKKVDLFRLTRKKDLAIAYLNNGKRKEKKDFVGIIDIQPTGKFTGMTCFTVEAKNSLFLMNDYIVTHNTRTMIADACYFSCSKMYDDYFGWMKIGKALPTLYISTEQEKDEIQTMMLAFLSNVPEDHILDSRYVGDEEERIHEAAKILKESNLKIECLPDFSLKDVESLIKHHIRENNTSYIMFDYIQTSLKILEEISKRSGGIKLREDNILFMLSRRLKDIANKYGVFILTATQLNGAWKQDESPDQNLLRGAKSIADSIDLGLILLPVSQEDLKNLESVLSTNTFKTPNIKISVYKNRRGKYKGIYLWSNADLSTCRVNPMFATDYGYNLIQMDDLHINVNDDGAF